MQNNKSYIIISEYNYSYYLTGYLNLFSSHPHGLSFVLFILWLKQSPRMNKSLTNIVKISHEDRYRLG